MYQTYVFVQLRPAPLELKTAFFFLVFLFCSMFFLGDAQFSEAVGYPMVQQWRVRSNLYKVKLSSITLSTGFCLNCCYFFHVPSQCS